MRGIPYNPISRYMTIAANLSLMAGIVLLLFNRYVAIALLVACPVLWSAAFLLDRTSTTPEHLLVAVNAVKAAVYTVLKRRYAVQRGAEEATLLAAAVVNEAFGAAPSSAKGVEYLRTNGDLIRQEAKSLSRDEDLCRIITEAALVGSASGHRLGGYGANGEVIYLPPPDLTRPAELGILRGTEQPPSPATFVRLANRFCRAVKLGRKT